MAQTERLTQLRQNLIEYYNDEELRTLCFDLGVDYDNLPGRAKADKARELLSDLDHRGRIPDLIKLCSIQRPNVPWQEILTAIQAEPPFKGLQYFSEADGDLFFGREVLTAQTLPGPGMPGRSNVMAFWMRRASRCAQPDAKPT